MATGKRVYVTGQDVLLRVTVVDGHDKGNPVVALGDGRYAIARDHLDAADLDPERPMTQEEQAAFDLEQAKPPVPAGESPAVEVPSEDEAAAAAANQNEPARRRGR